MAEHSLRQAAWIVRKDLQHELRSREAFLSTLLFAVVVLLIFAFAFDPGPADIERVGPGILWSALLFAAVLAIGRSMLTEREDGAIDGLLLAPMQRSSIYVGKACALLLLLLSTQLPTLLLFVVFFDVPVLPATTRLVPLLSVLLLASTGLAAIGTTVSAIAVAVPLARADAAGAAVPTRVAVAAGGSRVDVGGAGRRWALGGVGLDKIDARVRRDLPGHRVPDVSGAA